MSSKKTSLDDIFNDDEFGLLEAKPKVSNVMTEEERLIDSFEEVNAFYKKNNREPSTSSMAEYGLLAKLKNFRGNEEQKKILKPFDRYNLLGHVEIATQSIEEILSDNELGLLKEDDLSLFQYRHTPTPEDRAEADFVARRKSLSEEDFEKYEVMFHKVHADIKEGRRKIMPFKNPEKNLISGQFYIMDGLLLFLEEADLKREKWENKSGDRVRLEGRTRTIFENGTYSNMLFRSLGKQIQKTGKLVTDVMDDAYGPLFPETEQIVEEDEPSGWIYVLQTKSTKPELNSIRDLYKIGFTSIPVEERIKNASNEATYLYSDVKNVQSWKIYNRDAYSLEKLLHRFFAKACLDIELTSENGQRFNPREWFVVPLTSIEEAIQLILSMQIVNYEYDKSKGKICLKNQSGNLDHK